MPLLPKMRGRFWRNVLQLPKLNQEHISVEKIHELSSKIIRTKKAKSQGDLASYTQAVLE